MFAKTQFNEAKIKDKRRSPRQQDSRNEALRSVGPRGTNGVRPKKSVMVWSDANSFI